MTRTKNNRTNSSNNYHPHNATRDNTYRPPPPPYNLPPPPPPPPPSYHSSSNSRHDTYTPSSRYNDRDRDYDRGYDRNSRHDNSYRPLPPRPQDSSYRDSSFRPPQGDFTFRADKPSGVGDSYNSYRPSNHGPPRNAPRGPASYPAYDRPSGPRNFRGGRAGNEPRRPAWRPFRPAERAIVQGVGNQAPAEDYADEEHGVTYRAVDQLSDSDEADMDTSDSENESAEPSAKRARPTKKPASGDSVPKWCNPDPYDALPPVEDADKKRKDMVQLIRKARVQAAAPRSSLPGEDEEFIRLDVDSDDEKEADANEDDEDFIDPVTYNRGEQGLSNGSSVQSSQQPLHALPPKPVFDRPPSRAGQVAQQAAQPAPTGRAEAEAAPFIDLSRGDIFPASKHASFAIDVNKNPDLGTRKRTHDDVLKLPAHVTQYRSQGKKPPVGGDVVAEWRAKSQENPCPWVKAPTFNAHVNVRLHMEVRDFYEFVKPCQFEDRLRGKLVSDLNETISKATGIRDREMFPFGSYMSGLYLPTADMDLAYCSQAYVNGGPPRSLSTRQQRDFIGMLRRSNVAFRSNVDAILKAKVPIAKYVDNTTGLRVDISFENIGGLIAIGTFKAWREQYPAMPILVTLIKQYLSMRGLNEPVNGGIGGFSIICMVVSMLQMMPAVQSGSMVPEHNLGSLLMHFFDLYGNRFDYTTTALRLNPPGYVNKNNVRDLTYKNPVRLSIIDPNNPANDIAGGSKNYPQIVSCFRTAHDQLQDRLVRIARGEHFDSILEPILGGSYRSFREQRDHLRKLHTKVFGHCDGL